MSLDTAKAIATLNSLTATFKVGVETAKPLYPKICTIVNSNGASEDYGGLGSMPKVREWIGDRVFNKLRAGRFQIANRLWEDSLDIDREDLEDDKMGFYFPVMQELANEAAFHPDYLVVNDLILAGDATECFDGQNFFDTDHSWGDSGTQSNKITSAAVNPSAPTLAEVRTALDAARQKLIGYKNDQGNLFIRNPLEDLQGLHAFVPPQLAQTMNDALIPVVIGTTPTRLINPPAVTSLGYLTDPVKFWLFYTGSPLKPFVFQRRRPLKWQMKGMDDREFKAVKFMTDARYAVGFMAWWTAVQVTFTVP
jgi:phage major head subunit gpT-like protein